ncbi:MAG: response regulator [Spirochaetes bacterium]|nr:response regulator [Spirochaetota bacterium]
MQLLIVDDSELIRTLVEQVIRENLREKAENVVFHHAANGQDALEITQKYPINLIFLDWNMPVLDGIEFVRAIRMTGNKVSIVMITSITDSEKILQAAAAGVNSYIEKPVRGPQLWNQIGMFFKNAGF